MKLTTKATIIALLALLVLAGTVFAAWDANILDMNSDGQIRFGYVDSGSYDGYVRAKDKLHLRNDLGAYVSIYGDPSGDDASVVAKSVGDGAFTANVSLTPTSGAVIGSGGSTYTQMRLLSNNQVLAETGNTIGPRMYASDISTHGFASIRSAQKMDGEASLGRAFVTADKGYGRVGGAKLEWLVDTDENGVEDTALATIATDQDGNALMRSDIGGGASVTCNTDGDVVIELGGGEGEGESLMGGGDSMTENLEYVDPETSEVVVAKPYAEDVFVDEVDEYYGD